MSLVSTLRRVRSTVALRASTIFVAAALVASCSQDLVSPMSSIAPPADASSSVAVTNSVVMLSTTAYQGTSSPEAVAATALGYTVVMKDAAQWAAMTANDFAQYRAIILGDPRCGSINSAQAAVNNRAVWGPVVNGNVIIIGTDPVYHGKVLVSQKGVAFATAAAGKTGAYIATSCYGASAASLLLGLSSTLGTFESNGTSGDNALKVAEHPALDGLTSTYLSNWFSSVHNGFTKWPSDFEVLAIIGTGTVYRSPDGSFVGTPYILARGEGLVVTSDIALTPAATTATVGTTHTFTATVKAGTAPVAGAAVTFSIVDGPATGRTTTATTVTTNAAGVATFSITATSPATYGVRAGFTDSRGVAQTSGRAAVTFETPADATAPEVTPVTTGTLGHADFYTSDVNLTWTVVDNESPVTSKTGCDAVSMTTDNTGVTYSCSATSIGGTTTKSVTLKRDASAPLLDAVVAGTLGSNDWYTGNVNVTWNRSDATSGIEAFDDDHGGIDPCLNHTLTTNTTGVTYSCTVENGAGLETTKSVTVKRDATVPLVTGTPSGTLGENGWYTSDVSVGWSVSEAGPSGIVAPCTVSTVSSNTAGEVVTCTAKTGAGLPGIGSVTVKRDDVRPVVTGHAAGTLGAAGWYTSNVEISWGVTSSGPSGATADCPVVIVSENTASSPHTCVAKSGAGIAELGELTVKVDKTAPSVTGAIVFGTLGANGWYTSNVVVGWTPSPADAGPSGITASPSCGAVTLSTNTLSHTFSCILTTGAGVSSTQGSVTVKRDAVAPTISYALTGTTFNGWYTSNVGVNWTTNAGLSGVNSCTSAPVSVDGTNITFSCSALAGNGLTASLTTAPAKRDVAIPLIGYTGNAGTYTVDQTVSIACSASDATSGIASTTCANVSGAGYLFALGSNNYSATAKDNAGNTNSASTSFTVTVSATNLCALVQRWVDGAGIQNSMCTKLSKGNYAPFRNDLSAQSGKAISAANAAILDRLVLTLM